MECICDCGQEFECDGISEICEECHRIQNSENCCQCLDEVEYFDIKTDEQGNAYCLDCFEEYLEEELKTWN